MDNLRDILKTIYQQFGLSLWQDEKKFIGAFRDIAPERKREIRFLRDFIASGAPGLLLKAQGVDFDREGSTRRAIAIVQSVSYYSEEVIRYFCECLIDSLTETSATGFTFLPSEIDVLVAIDDPSNVVAVGDTKLECVLRSCLNIGTRGITIDDLLGITSLDAHNRGIKNISVLKYCRNLRRLNLHGNEIEDITSLQNCSMLYEIDLSNNSIRNIDAVRHMVELRIINLSNNRIKNLQPLGSSSKLKIVIANNNEISDICGLDRLKEAIMIELGANGITDISPLESCRHLRILWLYDNRILDYKPLSKITDLSIIWIGQTCVPCQAFENAISNLKRLYVAFADKRCYL